MLTISTIGDRELLRRLHCRFLFFRFVLVPAPHLAPYLLFPLYRPFSLLLLFVVVTKL